MQFLFDNFPAVNPGKNPFFSSSSNASQPKKSANQGNSSSISIHCTQHNELLAKTW